jgi:hypothetical protein
MLKLSLSQIRMPKLTFWDWVAIAVAAVGVVLTGANWKAAQSGSGSLTGVFVTVQLAICLGSLMILGKTAKAGTLWGILAAVAGTFVGMGGVLLAAALWTAA